MHKTLLSSLKKKSMQTFTSKSWQFLDSLASYNIHSVFNIIWENSSRELEYWYSTQYQNQIFASFYNVNCDNSNSTHNWIHLINFYQAVIAARYPNAFCNIQWPMYWNRYFTNNSNSRLMLNIEYPFWRFCFWFHTRFLIHTLSPIDIVSIDVSICICILTGLVLNKCLYNNIHSLQYPMPNVNRYFIFAIFDVNRYFIYLTNNGRWVAAVALLLEVNPFRNQNICRCTLLKIYIHDFRLCWSHEDTLYLN